MLYKVVKIDPGDSGSNLDEYKKLLYEEIDKRFKGDQLLKMRRRSINVKMNVAPRSFGPVVRTGAFETENTDSNASLSKCFSLSVF